MHTTATLAVTLAAAASVHAFAGTYPVVAWSPNGHLPSLPELDAVSSTRPPAAQQHFDSSTSDLCQLDALYVVSVPGLHASDLASFPTTASSTFGFRASLAQAQRSGAARTAPYVSDRLAVPPVGKIARRFARCGAGKDLQFKRFDDLVGGGEGASYGASTEEERRVAVLAHLDSQIADIVASAPASAAFLLTDLPNKLSSASPPPLKLAKRQQLMPSDASEETIEEVLEEIAEEEHVNSNALDEMLAEIESAHEVESPDEDPSAPSMSTEDEADPYASLDRWDNRILDVSSSSKNASKNRTSIFAPAEHSGLLHRYALFSPSLIVAILVTVVVLIPAVLVGTQALLSIETVNGLETKMTGSVGLDPSKQ
ncbi:hypothetical protein BMF94_2786 [Rhodotorula taiwanensis]|uniref:Protein BIG1 n=1 Tax=Rhodotorula taiwanensis TaxID=741276 RepID=A0A2S5BB15_9BASI|nr:hypothetical protein BMF94_2786 [Rhodotorula taiwanensis]